MSEISLKEYFAKLNSRLAANAADEVIHHCRHILQSYPKNVTAYRLLGRALVLNGRWDEGREALRRVLSVIPDDYAAHLALSEANERMDRADEAIWHLERALEQRPNDKDLIEALRGLYRRYRHVENLKIQLTAVAVARQNLRGGNYAQAIDTLRSALTRMNDRLDLKLLLAQILWQNGSEEEAAEIALEVLKVLPDCLEANRIMAKLWLSVDRPSDAQRFVNHLESVDPYLAVELVQGSAPDDDVFRIDELDYVRSAQSEMASDRPDWLREISVTPTATSEIPKAAVDDDWSSAMLKKPPTGPLKEVPPPPPAGQSMSARFAAMRQEEPASSGGLTDLFGKPDDSNAQELSSIFAGDHSDDEDPMAWMREAGVQIVDDEDNAPQESSYNNLFGDDDDDGPLPEEENPLAWLQSADVTIDDDEPSSTNTGDSPSWLYGNTSSEFAEAAAEPAVSDSLDWLQGDNLDEALGMDSLNVDPSGSTLIQMRSPTVSDRADQLFADANEPPAPAPRRGLTSMLQDTNFDWTNTQQDDKVGGDDEMDDWLNQFGPPAEPRKAVTETPDWLTDLEKPDDAASEDDAWFAPDEPESETEQPVAASKEFAWMSDEKSDDASGAASGDDNDWLAEFSPTDKEAEQPVEDDEFTWMAAESATEEPDAEEVPDWLSELNPEAAPTSAPAAESPVGSALKWLNSTPSADTSEPEAAAESEADEAMPDWLSELEPEGQSEEQPTPIAEETTLDTEFSWLSDDALGALDSTPAATSEFEPETEAAASDEIDWMSELEPQGESSATAEEVVPDWLSELEPEESSSEPEPVSSEQAVTENDFAWLNDEAEPAAEAAASVAPDWLSELAPEGALFSDATASESAVTDDSDFTWMSEEALATPQAEASAVAADDLDWLSELEPEQASNDAKDAQPVAEAATAADDSDFTWMSEESLAAPEAEPVSGDVPDWLSELEPDPAASEPESAPETVAAQDSEFTWMMEEALSKAEPEGSFNLEDEGDSEDRVVAGDVPDWLSELAPEPVSEPETEAAVVSDSEFTWMTDEALANAESATEAVDPEFVWMVDQPESSTEAEPEPEAELETAATGDLDWLSELEPEEASVSEPEAEPEAVAADDLDWLSELEPEAESAESEPEAEAESEAVAADDLSWLSDLPPVQETSASEPEVTAAEPVAADDLGWLSELEPAEASISEPEPEAVAADDSAWLTELEPEDETVSEPEPEPEAVAADASWLSELEPEADDSEAEPEAVAAEDSDWLTELQPEADEAEPEAVAADDSDWLSELEPEEEESEFEPEAMATGISGEDTATDDDFAWLDEQNAESEDEEESVAEPAALSEDASVDAEEEIGENEEDYAAASLTDDEALEPTAAHNAPDWLNAMVPGLDVDYEAPDEEFAEEEPAVEAEPEAATSKREYAWLVEMVEEENAATESPRFTFSRPPSWLQTVNGLSHTEADKVDDDLPDWPSDDADADVPEWLR